MKITDKIRYGAAELKAFYNANLGKAFTLAVVFHLMIIGLYFAISTGKAGGSDNMGSGKVKLVNIAPPPQRTDAPPPPPPPMVPPQFTGGGGGGGVASRAGDPVPIPDALVDPNLAEAFDPGEISVANPDAGDGTGPGNLGDGTGGDLLPSGDLDVRKPDPEPDPDADFDPSMTRPEIDLAEIQKLVVYPEIARKNGIQGKVQVRVLVDKFGKPTKYRIDASESKVLEAAAVEAVMKGTFTPALQNGINVSAWVVVPVTFKLED